jgi:hypothetical protein
LILRTQANGQWLCIHQTSHALMAAELCRHWGNRDFATPAPDAPVLLGIAQHDNGWVEWECAPEVRPDGVPMDFMHGPAAEIKRELWRRGISRAAAQHPYAGLLVSRHAYRLYQGDLPNLAPAEHRATELFLAEQDDLLRRMRALLAGDEELRRATEDAPLDGNTRLLQIGDSASLQVTIPWGRTRTFPRCPVDFAGTLTEITLTCEGDEIHFDPWPFGIDAFTVSIHGRLLDPTPFPTHAAYQAALASAPLRQLRWRVVKA